jgi:hypothetical protein
MKFFAVAAAAALASVVVAAPIAEPSVAAACYGKSCKSSHPLWPQSRHRVDPRPVVKYHARLQLLLTLPGGAYPWKREAEAAPVAEPSVAAACYGKSCT